MFTAPIVTKDWKYHVKSAFWTFVSIFLPVLFLEVKDLNVSTVKLALEAGGFAAAIRAFLRIIIEPLLSALWEVSKTMLGLLVDKIKSK